MVVQTETAITGQNQKAGIRLILPYFEVLFISWPVRATYVYFKFC